MTRSGGRQRRGVLVAVSQSCALHTALREVAAPDRPGVLGAAVAPVLRLRGAHVRVQPLHDHEPAAAAEQRRVRDVLAPLRALVPRLRGPRRERSRLQLLLS